MKIHQFSLSPRHIYIYSFAIYPYDIMDGGNEVKLIIDNNNILIAQNNDLPQKQQQQSDQLLICLQKTEKLSFSMPE